MYSITTRHGSTFIRVDGFDFVFVAGRDCIEFESVDGKFVTVPWSSVDHIAQDAAVTAEDA